ncbi:MAG: tetratricopeptide repeat protein [Ignavibacteriaceae bacterium]|nr:tetratricopeptide repeat protein [Ignavibacteriaceae bacterium]
MIKRNFENDLQQILQNYLRKEEISELNGKLKVFGENGRDFNNKVSEIYKRQLDLDLYDFSERIQIDRTITYSQKSLSPEDFSSLLINLGKLCISHGRLNLAHEVLTKARRFSIAATLKAESLLALSDVYSRRAKWEESISVLRNARIIYRNANDRTGIARCDNLMGTIYGDQGDFNRAKRCFQSSLSRLMKNENPELVATLENNLGIVEMMLGEKENAVDHFKRALELFDEIRELRRVAEIKYNIGLLYYEMQQFKSAIISFDESIELCLNAHFIPTLCLSYLAKANVLVTLSEFSNAREFADKALEVSHHLDDKLTIADIYRIKGTIERNLKNYNSAENYLLTSHRINVNLKNELNIAESSFELAKLYAEIGKQELKEIYLRGSINYYKQINSTERVKLVEEFFGVEKVY